MLKTWPCKGTGGCGGTYSAELTADSPADWNQDDWGAFMDAQSDHVATHGRTGEVTVHIRKQIARVRTYSRSNPLSDSAAFRLGSDKDGSQPLCGAAPTDRDMSWADGRFAKNRAYVTCERCLELRPAS
jgi:hypothetical protein